MNSSMMAPDKNNPEMIPPPNPRQSGSVIVMNRAHDRVLVPPPARAILAAFALVQQAFGFTASDAEVLERAAADTEDDSVATALRDLRARVQALLPPG